MLYALDLAQIIGGILVDIVVQPVLIQQVGVGTPAEQRRLCGIIAAVIVSGTCGFGMGATPNAMANMQAICDKYSPSVKAYLLIPLVGSLFADFLNSLVITVFINFI